MISKESDRRLRPFGEAEIKRLFLEYKIPTLSHNAIVASEVPFFAFKRRADMVCVGDFSSAYEIKGKGDSVDNIKEQLADYALVFDYVSVVVYESHIAKIRKFIPGKYGIIFVSKGRKIIEIRQPIQIRRLSRTALSSTLTIENIKTIFQGNYNSVQRFRSGDISATRAFAAKMLPKNKLREAFINQLKEKYNISYKMFRNEIGDEIHVEDIKILERPNFSISD